MNQPVEHLCIESCSSIALIRDGLELRGVYPPICRLGDVVIETRCRDGRLVAHDQHDKSWLKSRVQTASVVVFERPLHTSPTSVLVVVPDRDTELFSELFELQRLRGAPASVTLLDLTTSRDLLWKIVRRRVGANEIGRKKEMFALMLASEFLRDPGAYRRLDHAVTGIFLTQPHRFLDELRNLARAYLLRFGISFRRRPHAVRTAT